MRSCFLWHRWTVIEQEILPSAFEQVSKDHHVEELEGRPPYFHKPVIVTSRCQRCGTMRVQRI